MPTQEEIDAAIARAYERLDAKSEHRLKCPRCGHEDGVRDDPERSLYTCDQCGCRIAFGSEQPSIKIQPHADRRFVVATFATGAGDKKNEVALTLDRDYAAHLAIELLSVCAPGKWKALIAQAERAHDVPGAPVKHDDGMALDAPIPAPLEAEPARCPCGAPSDFPNGSCRRCHAAALGIAT